jgi:hypothetical protein
VNPVESDAWVEWPVAGVSMGRRWHAVRTVLVRPAGVETVRWGDVIVAGARDRCVAHRAVRRYTKADGATGWITKGDGSWFPDRWVIDATSLVGIVDGVRREDGSVTVLRRCRALLPSVTGWLLSWIWRPVAAGQGTAAARNVSSADRS